MKEQEEDYWGDSSVKKNRKKVNIFDDNVTVEAATDLAKYKKSLSLQDDEDMETVNWDETPITESRPVFEERPTASNTTRRPTTVEINQGGGRLPHFEPADPYPSRPSPTYTHSRSRSDVLVGSMGRVTMSKSPSIQEPSGFSRDPDPSISKSSGSQRQDSRPATSRHDQEIEFLKQQLQMAKNSIGAAHLKVEDTVKCMITGQPFTLEPYKSKDQKLALLDHAIKTHDGNAIIACVIFLKRTVKEQIFNMEMTRRPAAVDQYLAYLRSHYNLKELEDTLGMLGRTEEVAMLKYKQAISVNDPESKIHRLKACQRAHFSGSPTLEHDAGLIQQQIDLLHRQRPVDVADEMTQSEGKHIVFRKLPRATSIVNMPVITTLYYCCIYHYEEPENLFASPVAIRKQHQLSEKQFMWTAIKARAKLRSWGDIETLLTTKGWLGGTKLKSVIGFDNVAAILHKADAPSDKVSMYLKHVDDIDRRLALARKMQCHEAIIETYLAQRDRRALQTYQSRLKPNSKEWYYAKDVLSNNTTKWKT